MKTSRLHLAGAIVFLAAFVVTFINRDTDSPEQPSVNRQTVEIADFTGPSSTTIQEPAEIEDPVEWTADALATALPDVLILTEDQANELPAPDDGDRGATDLPPGEIADHRESSPAPPTAAIWRKR